MAQLVDLSQWLESLPDKLQPTQGELAMAATKQIERIKSRTSTGIGVDGQPFADYAPATKKSPPVDLFKSGQMLGSITQESTDTEAHIFFADPDGEQKARYHKSGTSKMPKRDFFGVSLADREEIVSDIREQIFNRVKNG